MRFFFDEMDSNKDGLVQREEFQAAMAPLYTPEMQMWPQVRL